MVVVVIVGDSDGIEEGGNVVVVVVVVEVDKKDNPNKTHPLPPPPPSPSSPPFSSSSSPSPLPPSSPLSPLPLPPLTSPHKHLSLALLTPKNHSQTFQTLPPTSPPVRLLPPPLPLPLLPLPLFLPLVFFFFLQLPLLLPLPLLPIPLYIFYKNLSATYSTLLSQSSPQSSLSPSSLSTPPPLPPPFLLLPPPPFPTMHTKPFFRGVMIILLHSFLPPLPLLHRFFCFGSICLIYKREFYFFFGRRLQRLLGPGLNKKK